MMIIVTSAVADNDVIFDDGFEFPEPKTLSDCPDCPEMVVLQSGSYMMGTPWDEPESSGLERPQHEVTVPVFALGSTEITFAQWDACVFDGGCSHSPTDHGWGAETCLS